MQGSRIFRFSPWRLFPAALAMALLTLFSALNLYGSNDPALARIGAILLPVASILGVGLLVAIITAKPCLAVDERTLALRLPLRTRRYAWSDIEDVNLERTTIRIRLKNGDTESLGHGLENLTAAYAAIREAHRANLSSNQALRRAT